MISILSETCNKIDQNECVLINVFRLNVFWSKNINHFFSKIVLQSINTSKSMRFYQLDQDFYTYYKSKLDHETSNNLLSFNCYRKIIVCESKINWILFLIALLLMRFVIIKYFVIKQRSYCRMFCNDYVNVEWIRWYSYRIIRICNICFVVAIMYDLFSFFC